ncbi:MAG: DNA polymerase Y family protein [Bacillota bacterium]|jgi:DNA polymerase-4
MRSIAYMHIPFLHSAAHVLLDPDLRGTSFAAVNKNTVIGVSPELFAAGVLPGATRRHARQACPGAVFVDQEPDAYPRLANKVWDICYEHTPLVEPIAVDGAFADFTGCGDVPAIADSIVVESKDKAGLEVRIGLAGNRLIARIAAEADVGMGVSVGVGAGLGVGVAVGPYPEQVITVASGLEERFLSKLPVGSLWPLSPETVDKLLKLGINTVGQLQAVPLSMLTSQLGEAGLAAHLLSRGIDRSPVRAAYPEETIECSMSFDFPVCEWPDLEQCLRVCASEIAARLIASGSRAVSCIELELDMAQLASAAGGVAPDGAGNSSGSRDIRSSGPVLKRHYFRRPTDSLPKIMRAVIHAAEGRVSGPVSAIRVRASGLVAPAAVQLSIFGPAAQPEPGQRELEHAIESIREKFGARSVTTANTLVRSRHDRMLAESLL